jgi:hypothetical protein
MLSFGKCDLTKRQKHRQYGLGHDKVILHDAGVKTVGAGLSKTAL